MVLLYNVYLTDTPGNFNCIPDRGQLPFRSKLEVAKYSLCSLASAYDWTKVIINIELDPNVYSEQQINQLPSFVKDTFKNTEIIYSDKRIKLQKDWKNIYKQINSDFIFLLCNHDHIFLDSNNDCLTSMIETAKNRMSEYPTIIMSHWPENIRWAKCGYIELNDIFPKKFNEEYKINDFGLSYKDFSIDSLNIITKELYYNWFFIGDWPNLTLTRADGVCGRHPDIIKVKESVGETIPKQLLMIPYKEQMRHFDGYIHQRIDNNTCPALDIPSGFFNKQIRIRYGYEDYKEGWVNINPKKINYRAYDVDGADYKLALEDIPLFWKDRICEIDINKNINEEELIQYRLQAILNTMYSDNRYSPYIDEQTQKNTLNYHLKTYKKYKLDETE